jgi:manganese efflux pump family protein
MGFLTLVLIGIGLSMDALAVSVAAGFTLKRARIPSAVKIGFFFGGFQALMPFLGWAAGVHLQKFIQGVDHWVAFALLSFVGGKMIYEAFKLKEAEKQDYLHTPVLFMLSLATSIDAFAVGLSFAMLKVAILGPVAIIGFTTFFICFFGLLVGKKAGHIFESKIEVFGGLVLICIGVKILVQHLTA